MDSFNPIALRKAGFNLIVLRKAKIAYNFGLSECNRVKGGVHIDTNVFLI